MKIRTKAE